MSYNTRVEYVPADAPKKSGLAITSLVLGLLSLLCMGVLAGIPAAICGIIALSKSVKDPERYGGRGMAITGLITSFLGTVIWITLGIMAYMGAISFGSHVVNTANRQGDFDRLNQINRTVVTFADTRGNFPASLADSFPMLPNPQMYVSPSSHTDPLSPPINPTDRFFRDDLDQHCDFEYIGADLPARRLMTLGAKDIIVTYGRQDFGGRNIGFADGHAEFVDQKDLASVFDRSNRARTSYRLPSVVLDGPPPMPPARIAINPNQNPGGAPVPPNIPDQGVPNIPRPPALHTSFTDVDDALKYVLTGQSIERNAALTYLERSAPGDDEKKKIAATMEQQLGATQGSFDRIKILGMLDRFGSKENAAAVRKLLPTTPNAMDQDAKAVINLLAKWKDTESIPQIAGQLGNFFNRDAAQAALISYGSAAETDVMPLVTSPDGSVSVAAIKILGQVGTEKSVVPLNKAMYIRSGSAAEQAIDALRQIASRDNLKPEQYLYALIDLYKIDAPVGFTLDTSVSSPNTRQWVRSVSGRVVKSYYAVTVKYADNSNAARMGGVAGRLPPGFTPPTGRVGAPDTTPTIEAVKITFKQVSSEGNNVTKTVHYSATDGDYVLELTATVDSFDAAAGNNMTAAAKKIQAK